MPDPTTPSPMPEADSGNVMLTDAQQAALLEVLPDNGDSVELSADADGGTVMRAGVTFTCDSAYPCTVTVSNSAGAIVATWSSQKLSDGMAGVMAMGHEPPPVTDPLVELNAANATTVGFILKNALNGAADSDGADNLLVDATPSTPNVDESADNLPQAGAYATNDGPSTTTPVGRTGNHNIIGGLGLGQYGADNLDTVTLKSSLNPNAADFNPDSDTTTDGLQPSGGSTISAKDDNVMTNADTVALSDWSHRVLFRDWGDTDAGGAVMSGDGGFETGALIYTNMMAPTNAPFDRDLHKSFVHVADWFMFSRRFADTVPGTGDTQDASTTRALAHDAVRITLPAKADANQQTMNMVFTVGAPQLETLADTVEFDSEHRGTYFGAQGTYRCVAASGCDIRRATAGDTSFGVDLPATVDAARTPDWWFKPDPNETVKVPDQDWVVFGAWLTTPDVMSGTHRVGVSYNGMDPYAAANGVFGSDDTTIGANGLAGSAKYSGGAAGVYVDGDESGMFTARAMLTAYFDVDGDGTVDATDKDMMMMGRIDNFKDTAGNYLGTDTADMPNDPTAGGENDWVVTFESSLMRAAADHDGAYSGTVGGSADGVSWSSSEWNAQFYGPGDTATSPKAPTGVAGDFRAYTGAGANKGVVGAFGADQD